MTYHSKYPEVRTLIENNINVLLEGGAGSGKSTIIKQVAEDLSLDFFSISMTKQTTLNALIGFISINGTYIPSQLRKAVEFGGLVLLDEIDAADPNTLLCLNTLENGYLSCPDGIVQKHENFRLTATSNPANEHQIYTGRSKLDAATLDRFDVVAVPRDNSLELTLTDEDTTNEINLMRTILSDNSISRTLSMRDCLRYYQRKQIGLASDYPATLLVEKHLHAQYLDIFKEQEEEQVKVKRTQSECTTIDELWETVLMESNNTKDEL